MKKIKFLWLFIIAFLVGSSCVSALTVTEDLTLTEDLTEAITVSGKTVTINLNGHSVISTANGVLRASNGAVVTVRGSGTIQSTANNAVIVEGGSTVVLEGGTIKSQEFGVLVTSNSTFTMNDGLIETVDNCGVGGNGTDSDNYKNYTININGGTINANITSAGYVSCGIYHPNKGTVNVTGGVINSSNGAGIVQRAGVLNITGGEINATGTLTGKVGDSRVVVSANAVVVDREANYPEVATIETSISRNAVLNGAAGAIKVLGSDEQIELTGGVYSSEPAEEQIPEGYSAYQVIAGENEDKYVVVKEDEVQVLVVDGIVPAAEVEKEDVALVVEAIKDKYTLGGYYEIDAIMVTPNDDVIGVVEETTEKVEVTVGLPQDLPAVKDGYVRKYYIVRIHNGETTIIDDVKDNGDGTITFNSNKFSTYALAYNDVVKTTTSPNTFDGISIYMITFVISAALIMLGSKSLKKRFN